MPNNRLLTLQTSEFWNAQADYVGKSIWPGYWPDKWD